MTVDLFNRSIFFVGKVSGSVHLNDHASPSTIRFELGQSTLGFLGENQMFFWMDSRDILATFKGLQLFLGCHNIIGIEPSYVLFNRFSFSFKFCTILFPIGTSFLLGVIECLSFNEVPFLYNCVKKNI